MADERPFLAFDLGAGSGRAFLGFVEDNQLKLEEIHRFRNNPILLGTTLYWDFLHIWDNILLSLKKSAHAGFHRLAGIGVNSWNCDFGLVDANGMLLLNPVCYRDPGTESVEATIHGDIDDFELYQLTGAGFNSISALSRFVDFQHRGLSGIFDLADTYLPIPDLVRYYLTGIGNAEESILWGSQLVDLKTRTWDQRLLTIASIEDRLLPEIVPAGTVTGTITSELADLTGIAEATVIAVAEHDTISATLSVFETEGKSIILSAGTWFIIGQLLKEPAASIRAYEMQVLNETGYRSFFFARNLMGFYILENLMGYWNLEGEDWSYDSLIREAEKARPFRVFIDVNDPMFFSSQNMPESLHSYLQTSGQEITVDKGSIARAVLEGLAFSVRGALEDLLEVLDKQPEYLVVIGGGTKNRFLCRLIADATGMDVVLGPAEAAVIGNIGVQSITAGQVGSIEKYQTLLHASYAYDRIHPEKTEEWRRRS